MNGEWFPGRHEAIVSAEEFAAAHRGRVPGRGRGTDLLSGRVCCGLCGRLMAIDTERRGAVDCTAAVTGARAAASPGGRTWDCSGPPCLGCSSSARTRGCRRRSAGARAGPNGRPREAGGEPAGRRPAVTLARPDRRNAASCSSLYYADKIGAELFAEEEARLSIASRSKRYGSRVGHERVEKQAEANELAQRFEKSPRFFGTSTSNKMWAEATEHRAAGR